MRIIRIDSRLGGINQCDATSADGTIVEVIAEQDDLIIPHINYFMRLSFSPIALIACIEDDICQTTASRFIPVNLGQDCRCLWGIVNL